MAEREEISFAGELQRISTADPFVSFTITMVSGQQYRVDENDTLAIGRSVVTLVSYRKGYHTLRQSQMSELSLPGDQT